MPRCGLVVDIGCGAGETSVAIASAYPALSVVGVDLSLALVAAARIRSTGLANVDFRVGAVETILPSLAPVDLLFSRHGVMFFADPVAGLAMLRAAVAPGGWLVFSCFADMASNGWASEVVAAVTGAEPSPTVGYEPGPFGFADPAFVGAAAVAAGWRPEPPVAAAFAYVAGEGLDPIGDAVDYFTRIGPAAGLLRAMPPIDAVAAKERMRMAIARRLIGDRVAYPAAAWLWSMQAV